MNAKLVKKIKQHRANDQELAEAVQELYQRASELRFITRARLAWALLTGNKNWSGR